MKIFFDFEFTGLHKNTTPISIGLVTDEGNKFYAEFNDFDNNQVDGWIQDNVISKLLYNEHFMCLELQPDNKTMLMKDDKQNISNQLNIWLSQFKEIEFWGDCVAYDWILFVDLIGMGKPMRKMPKNFVSYQAYDVFTILKIKGVNSKENRHKLLGLDDGKQQHNSLYDAEITKKLYEWAIGITTGKKEG
jgi:hypothetical protein